MFFEKKKKNLQTFFFLRKYGNLERDIFRTQCFGKFIITDISVPSINKKGINKGFCVFIIKF